VPKAAQTIVTPAPRGVFEATLGVNGAVVRGKKLTIKEAEENRKKGYNVVELGNMQYSTPELIEQLNSSDTEAVDDAMKKWEKAIVSYKASLQKIRREMPSHSRPIAELSLHDWDLIEIASHADTAGPGGGVALIVLKHNKSFVFLSQTVGLWR
jgi:hypothetical protein